MCPHCGRDAPIVYRGPLAYCSACNRARVPLSAAGVNLTGKPAKIGGTLAKVLGWVVLALMLGIALIVGAVLQAIFPAGAVVGWAVGAVIAALGVAAALVLLMGGRFLHRTGDRASTQARKSAVTALAEHQGGIVRADGVAKALGIPSAEADAFLTELSRQPDADVVLEVDADGKLYYRFPAFAPQAPWPPLGTGTPAPNAPNAQAVAPEELRLRVARTEIAAQPRVARTEVVQPVRVAPPADRALEEPLEEPLEKPGSTKRTQA
jgi:hypothetical protein